MTRQEIKTIVYKYLTNLFYDKHEFEVEMSQYPYDGEDRQLYTEVHLDSLDILIFITNLEKEFSIVIDDDLFKYDCTVRNIIDYIDNKINHE